MHDEKYDWATLYTQKEQKKYFKEKNEIDFKINL